MNTPHQLMATREIRNQRAALRARHAQRPDLFRLDELHRGQRVGEDELQVSGDDILHRQYPALVGNFDGLHAGEDLEHLPRELRDAARAARAVVELAGIRFCEVDQLAEGFRRDVGVDYENVRTGGDERDRDEIALDVVRHLCHEGIHRRGSDVADHEAVAVVRLARRVFHADRACRARLAFDDHRLSPDLRELRPENPGHEVRAPSRRIGHDELHRFGRPALGERLTRE
jgi:hypothetical protein